MTVVALAAVSVLAAAGAAGAQDDPPEGGPVQPLNPIPITPTCPDATSWAARADQGGAEVAGTCWGNAAQAPGTAVPSAEVWAWYGCDQWRPYSPGSRVSRVDRHGDQPLLLEDILQQGLDPTVVYYWYTIECEHHSVGPDGDTVIEVWGWGLLVIGETPPVDPVELRDLAMARIDPAPPTPLTSPSWTEVPSVVNMATWLWLPEEDWAPVEEAETANFVTVTVQVRPVDHTWVFGDGSSVVCSDGPGASWPTGGDGVGRDEAQCSHTFAAASTGSGFAASVSVRWVAHWWLNGNDMGDFGELTRDATFEVPVTEIQAIEIS